MQIPENCCVLLNDTVRQQSCESCVVNAMRVLRVCSLSRACIASIEPVCSTVFSCLIALINPIRGGPLHFEAGFVLEIMRRIVSKYPEHGDRNSSSGIVFVASRLDLFSFLLNILENPSGIGQVKEPNIVRAEAIEILNMLETVSRLLCRLSCNISVRKAYLVVDVLASGSDSGEHSPPDPEEAQEMGEEVQIRADGCGAEPDH